MKVQILKQGNRIFLKGYLFGFIPMYWYEGYDGGWEFTKSQIDMDKAVSLVDRWKAQKKMTISTN